jgi:hypothetical protein
MTVKRDLKRRVRQRQARTGEAYVTARRHVLAARPAHEVEAEAPTEAETEAETDAEPGADIEPGADVESAIDSATTAAAEPPRGPTTTAGEPGGRATPVPTDAVPSSSADDADTGPIAVARGAAAGSSDRGAGDTDTGRIAVVEVPATADRPEAPVIAASRSAVPVVELIDVSAEARRANILCRVAMFPALAARLEPAVVLARLHALLVATAEDPQLLVFSQVALTGRGPQSPPQGGWPPNFDALKRFLRRARAGLGGVSGDGNTLAFHVAGQGGLVAIQCALHWPGPSLVLQGLDDMIIETEALRERLLVERGSLSSLSPARVFVDVLAVRGGVPRTFEPILFVIHDGRRHAIARDEFLIGRSRGTVHLAIKDGMVSRHHAAVIRRDGAYYLRDLGSTHGITYKGMRIDNKRIEEGDVFQLGDHELRFTFRDDK